MKVAYGFFSFTEVTDPAAHHSYNEWHQLDHLPEQFPLPGIVYGQRWVSTPACRALRAVSESTLDPIHYVTCYLMAEPIADTVDEFFALGAELHRLDRFHRQRRARLTGPFAVLAAAAAPRVLVSAAAIPFRAHRGIYVVVEDIAVGPDRDGPARAAEYGPLLVEVPGVAGVWTFETNDAVTSPRWTEGRRRITVAWLDAEAVDVAARIAPVVAARLGRGGSTRVTFAGPFETITPWECDWFDAPR